MKRDKTAAILGYGKLLPNVVRPILVPVEGPITGHCIIPDTVLFDDFHTGFLTKTILAQNKSYQKETNDPGKVRAKFIENRNKFLVKNIKSTK